MSHGKIDQIFTTSYLPEWQNEHDFFALQKEQKLFTESIIGNGWNSLHASSKWQQ